MKNWRKLAELIDYSTLNEYIKEECKNAYKRTYDIDIYAYINDDETEVTFETFGGDDHFLIYTFKSEYYNFLDEFNSDSEFVDYMVELYSVTVPFDEFTDEDGDIDYEDCAEYIMENYEKEYDKAISDLVNDAWEGTIINEIIDDIQEMAEQEAYEEEVYEEYEGETYEEEWQKIHY